MEKQLVFGHRSPDTDAIVAAIGLSYLENQLGKNTEAVALGEPTAETRFVLDYFGETMPRVITKAASEVATVMLVDHNERQQSVADIEQLKVSVVVDHHRLANFTSNQPLYYRAEPVGCTSTILWELFKELDIEVPAKLAGLLLSAIISDTLLLKSPTTTLIDRRALANLAIIAQVDPAFYGPKMLRAGTRVDTRSVHQILAADTKDFIMVGHPVKIANVNVVAEADIFKRQTAFEQEMQQEADTGYDLVILMVTNILIGQVELLVIGNQAKIVETAFNKKLRQNRMQLPNVVSRKKQIVPALMVAFKH
ncbi:manganese-dependent inorganic pyrophosphatase [Loigolactobacillus iwatensis]|uniref:manganese-dependent inorganic pyrophosphatase n=1 Tax=Loigolactobacillus iwatensis TaxID=1267156 RepID=UPI000F7DA961|nr:manganese-dependent inorganic pyrophosphatase [Loigolactobacillus iwatensis]